jgi:hypothetical protein
VRSYPGSLWLQWGSNRSSDWLVGNWVIDSKGIMIVFSPVIWLWGTVSLPLTSLSESETMGCLTTTTRYVWVCVGACALTHVLCLNHHNL